MRRGNVATYSIDPRGHVTIQELTRECFPSPLPDPCMGDARGADAGLGQPGAPGAARPRHPLGGLRWIRGRQYRRLRERRGPHHLGSRQLLHARVLHGGHEDERVSPARGAGQGEPGRVASGTAAATTSAERRGEQEVDPLLALSTGALPETDLPLRVRATPLPGRIETRACRLPSS